MRRRSHRLPRRTRRLLFAAVLGLAFVSLAGCIGGSDRGGSSGTPGGDGSDGSDGSDLPGPFFGFVPGVEAVTLPDPTGLSGVSGAVFDVDTGQAITDARIVIACAASGAGIGADSVFVPIEADGTFSYDESGALTGCQELRYEFAAVGYTVSVPLTSGPLVPGLRYVVYGGMEAIE